MALFKCEKTLRSYRSDSGKKAPSTESDGVLSFEDFWHATC